MTGAVYAWIPLSTERDATENCYPNDWLIVFFMSNEYILSLGVELDWDNIRHATLTLTIPSRFLSGKIIFLPQAIK